MHIIWPEGVLQTRHYIPITAPPRTHKKDKPSCITLHNVSIHAYACKSMYINACIFIRINILSYIYKNKFLCSFSSFPSLSFLFLSPSLGSRVLFLIHYYSCWVLDLDCLRASSAHPRGNYGSLVHWGNREMLGANSQWLVTLVWASFSSEKIKHPGSCKKNWGILRCEKYWQEFVHFYLALDRYGQIRGRIHVIRLVRPPGNAIHRKEPGQGAGYRRCEQRALSNAKPSLWWRREVSRVQLMLYEDTRTTAKSMWPCAHSILSRGPISLLRCARVAPSDYTKSI